MYSKLPAPAVRSSVRMIGSGLSWGLETNSGLPFLPKVMVLGPCHVFARLFG